MLSDTLAAIRLRKQIGSQPLPAAKQPEAYAPVQPRREMPMLKQMPIYLALILFCCVSNGCTSLMTYSIKNNEGARALTAEKQSGMFSESLELRGNIPGQVIRTGRPLKNIRLEASIDGQPTISVHVAPDGGFALSLDEKWSDKKTIESFKNSKNLCIYIPVSFNLPWMDKLQETGETLRPSPDIFKYFLALNPDGNLAITDLKYNVVSAIVMHVRFKKYEDKSIKKALRLKKKEEALYGSWETFGIVWNGDLHTFSELYQLGYSDQPPAFILQLSEDHSGVMEGLNVVYNPQLNALSLASSGEVEQFEWSYDPDAHVLSCGNENFPVKLSSHLLFMNAFGSELALKRQ